MGTRKFAKSLDTQSIKYLETKRRFLEFARTLDSEDRENNIETWRSMVSFLTTLVAVEHWNRKHIYEMFIDCIDDEDTDLSSEAIDVLIDYEGTICGDCSIESVPRFPGEPEDPLAFRQYLYAGIWLK